MQAARRIDNHCVKPELLCRNNCTGRTVCGVEVSFWVMHAKTGLRTEHVQLGNRGRSSYVGGDQQRMAPLRDEPAPEFGRGRRLPGSLQPQHQHDLRPVRRCAQTGAGVAKQDEHLVSDDRHNLLGRRQTIKNLLVNGAVTNPVDERLDNLEVDIRL